MSLPDVTDLTSEVLELFGEVGQAVALDIDTQAPTAASAPLTSHRLISGSAESAGSSRKTDSQPMSIFAVNALSNVSIRGQSQSQNAPLL